MVAQKSNWKKLFYCSRRDFSLHCFQRSPHCITSASTHNPHPSSQNASIARTRLKTSMEKHVGLVDAACVRRTTPEQRDESIQAAFGHMGGSSKAISFLLADLEWASALELRLGSAGCWEAAGKIAREPKKRDPKKSLMNRFDNLYGLINSSGLRVLLAAQNDTGEAAAPAAVCAPGPATTQGAGTTEA